MIARQLEDAVSQRLPVAGGNRVSAAVVSKRAGDFAMFGADKDGRAARGGVAVEWLTRWTSPTPSNESKVETRARHQTESASGH